MSFFVFLYFWFLAFHSWFFPFYPLWIPPWSGRGKSDCNSLWVSLWRLELWTIPNNWRTNCPQTYRREESTVQKDVELRLLHKKKFRAKINFHSHNSILSWAKIATQKKSKRLRQKKKRKTLFFSLQANWVCRHLWPRWIVAGGGLKMTFNF